jgi:hypothetical protein
MKKLLFVLVFTFIGQQVISQMYIVQLQDHAVGNCYSRVTYEAEFTLTTISPSGTVTKTCIESGMYGSDINNGLASLNIELNSILNQGYKIVPFSTSSQSNGFSEGTIFYLAIP